MTIQTIADDFILFLADLPSSRFIIRSFISVLKLVQNKFYRQMAAIVQILFLPLDVHIKCVSFFLGARVEQWRSPLLKIFREFL